MLRKVAQIKERRIEGKEMLQRQLEKTILKKEKETVSVIFSYISIWQPLGRLSCNMT